MKGSPLMPQTVTSKAPEEASEWNVLATPWLEVIDGRGQLLSVSPLKALETASDLHSIVAANPLDMQPRGAVQASRRSQALRHLDEPCPQQSYC